MRKRKEAKDQYRMLRVYIKFCCRQVEFAERMKLMRMGVDDSAEWWVVISGIDI